MLKSKHCNVRLKTASKCNSLQSIWNSELKKNSLAWWQKWVILDFLCSHINENEEYVIPSYRKRSTGKCISTILHAILQIKKVLKRELRSNYLIKTIKKHLRMKWENSLSAKFIDFCAMKGPTFCSRRKIVKRMEHRLCKAETHISLLKSSVSASSSLLITIHNS